MSVDVNDKKFIKDLCQIAKKAGSIILKYYGKRHTYMGKEDGSFATEADIESENFLKNELGNLLGDASFLAEESGNSRRDDKDYKWVKLSKVSPISFSSLSE